MLAQRAYYSPAPKMPPVPKTSPVPVRQRRKRRARVWAAAFAVWGLAVGMCLTYVHRHGVAAQRSIAVSNQRQEINRLLAENELLVAEVREMKSLSRIAEIATKPVAAGGLGMISPRNVQITLVGPDSLASAPSIPAGRPGHAEPAADQGRVGLWPKVLALLASLSPGG